MKGIKLNIDDKEYILGFANRESLKRAERRGLTLLDASKVITYADKMFYCSLLDRQPEMTEEEANKLIDRLPENGYDYTEIIQELRVLVNEVFSSTQIKDPKKMKQIKIVNC